MGHISRGLPPVTLGWWAPIADLPSMLQVRHQFQLCSEIPLSLKGQHVSSSCSQAGTHQRGS